MKSATEMEGTSAVVATEIIAPYLLRFVSEKLCPWPQSFKTRQRALLYSRSLPFVQTDIQVSTVQERSRFRKTAHAK